MTFSLRLTQLLFIMTNCPGIAPGVRVLAEETTGLLTGSTGRPMSPELAVSIRRLYRTCALLMLMAPLLIMPV